MPRPSLVQRKSRINHGDFDDTETLTSPPNVELNLRSDPTPTTTPQLSFDDERGKREDLPSGPGPPPDGGLDAWLQVLGAFFINFNTW